MDNTIIIYLIKASLALILFYGVYMLFLRKDTFFTIRRFYFLFAVFFSLIFPLVSIEIPIANEAQMQIPVYWLSEIDAVTVSPKENPSLSMTVYFLIGLSVISALYACRFIVQILSLLKVRMKSESEKTGSCRIIKLEGKETSSFSFFHWIFVAPELYNTSGQDEIVAHEQAHARQYHSVDVLIFEVLCICFWWNPCVWLLKREMKINLEYLADQGVLKAGFDQKEYQYILLKASNRSTGIPLINNFNVSQLKKRITMMNKQETFIGKASKYLLVVPVGLALLLGNAAQASPDLIDVISNKTAISDDYSRDDLQVPQKKDGVYASVEKMPQYPGGESAMFEYLAKNLKYPTESSKNKIQGRVTVRFIVKSTGEISSATVIRGIDPLLDAEALRVVNAMPAWIPGKQKDKAVDVYYALPIVFKLSRNNAAPTSSKDKNEVMVVGYGDDASNSKVGVAGLKKGGSGDDRKAFVTVEQMPKFPGGESAMQKYIGENLKYPEEASKNKIQGRVTIRFVVSETGAITDAVVIRGISPECDAEALRVINAMPNWTPGKQNGKDVSVYFTLPIVFRLKTDKAPVTNQLSSEPISKSLFVLDGKVIDNETYLSLNTSKIESVNIKKDAASLAKYGTAANGKENVIEITTKK
ncbi:TonB family protein [Dysgonomonas sp. PFB1-18]|uniref:M56 family metallopeptidase n=1 Tax=unclassified Dysgonomonas TaxID=2630389 RepID=UPI002473594E|nr:MULTISPECIES: M56 family metallopeptidase [unclassified Dysgonomonas]MDH6310740.1 TonB family protein [Dysgonomonas sp. PF1-14]MDH6340590.1 TonB family protein [Dysgonomonas sp. PF1-16]MDH6382153.1 TonB family protein [Dysgonomonas sp. PFB1-18]MDH6399497.1 TonB family protein [Dysgonomonas sp. PF1-23]